MDIGLCVLRCCFEHHKSGDEARQDGGGEVKRRGDALKGWVNY